jgi:hypothetical protein
MVFSLSITDYGSFSYAPCDKYESPLHAPALNGILYSSMTFWNVHLGGPTGTATTNLTKAGISWASDTFDFFLCIGAQERASISERACMHTV